MVQNWTQKNPEASLWYFSIMQPTGADWGPARYAVPDTDVSMYPKEESTQLLVQELLI